VEQMITVDRDYLVITAHLHALVIAERVRAAGFTGKLFEAVNDAIFFLNREGYFSTFDRIGYSSWERSVSIEKDTARVVQRFYLEVEKGEKKNDY
jgi:hypothetical protein